METADKVVTGIAVTVVGSLIAVAIRSGVNAERWDRACAAAGGVRVSVNGAFACAKIELLPVKVTP